MSASKPGMPAKPADLNGHAAVPEADADPEAGRPDLLSNLIRRTDDDFAGKPVSRDLIGDDLPEDDEDDEDADLDELPPERPA